MGLNEEPIEFHALGDEEVTAAAPIPLTFRERMSALVRKPLFWGGVAVVSAGAVVGAAYGPQWLADFATPPPSETALPVVTATPAETATPTPSPAPYRTPTPAPALPETPDPVGPVEEAPIEEEPVESEYVEPDYYYEPPADEGEGGFVAPQPDPEPDDTDPSAETQVPEIPESTAAPEPTSLETELPGARQEHNPDNPSPNH